MSLKIAALIATAAAVAVGGGIAYAGIVQTQISWSEAPSVSDIAAAYPARAKAAGISGTVNLTCEMGRDGHPKDCEALTEKPSGYGWSGGALAESGDRKRASPMGDLFIPSHLLVAAVLKGGRPR